MYSRFVDIDHSTKLTSAYYDNSQLYHIKIDCHTERKKKFLISHLFTTMTKYFFMQ